MIGLSKIPRLVDVFARRLQMQERLTNQIAETIREKIEPLGVASSCEGDAPLHVDARRGEAELVRRHERHARRFRDNARTRMEFLELIRGRANGPLATSPAGLACVAD